MSEPVQPGKPIPQGQPEKAPKKKPLDVSQKLPDLTPPGTSMPPVETRFSDLPDDVIEYILSLLRIKDSVAAGKASKRLHELRELSLESARHLDLFTQRGLTAESLKALLSRFPNLTSLSLPWDATDDFLQVLAEPPLCEKLTSLECNYCKITDEGFKKLARCTKLQKLHVVWTNIDKALIAICESCPDLMDLNCNGCLALGDAGFQAIARCSKLQKVNLRRTDLKDAALISICQNCPELIDLDFRDCSDSSIMALQSIPGLSKLQKLGGTFNAASLKSSCEKCPDLIDLDCGCAGITNSARFQVIALCTKLRRLNLEGTVIDDAALQIICRSCPELEHLNCTQCYRLTSQGLLQSIVLLKKLTSLDLTDLEFLDVATAVEICKACPGLVEVRHRKYMPPDAPAIFRTPR